MGVAATEIGTGAALLIALAGGVIGTLVTAGLAFGTRINRIGPEIAANDRAIRALDIDLESWIADATVNLVREVRAITNATGPSNTFYSGAHAVQIAHAKELALEKYRNEGRRTERAFAEIVAGEGWLHGLLRAWRYDDAVLQAPKRGETVLEKWAEPITRHGGPAPIEVDDPRNRTFATALKKIEADPLH